MGRRGCATSVIFPGNPDSQNDITRDSLPVDERLPRRLESASLRRLSFTPTGKELATRIAENPQHRRRSLCHTRTTSMSEHNPYLPHKVRQSRQVVEITLEVAGIGNRLPT
jgi:hypothetical protein